MKKIILLAVAFTTMLASCAKTHTNNNGGEPGEPVVNINGLSIKVSPTTAATRSTNESAADGTSNVEFTGGMALVFDIDGSKVGSKILSAAAKTTPERIDGVFASNSRVLVLGNMPAGDQAKLEAVATLNEVWTVLSAMPAAVPYQQAPMTNIDANGDGNLDFDDLPKPVQVDGSNDIYLVTAKIAPAIARIELVDIAATKKATPVALDPNNPTVKTPLYIKSFDVTGVFLSDFYSDFLYNGSGAGTLFVQDEAKGKDFTELRNAWPTYADGAATEAASAVTATTTPARWVNDLVMDPAVANLTGGNVWSYNVAAKGKPNVIIRLRNVIIAKVAGDAAVTSFEGQAFNAATAFYLRIAGYTYKGAPVDNFARGTIYRIGGAEASIEFSPENLMFDPVRDIDKTIDAKVQVLDWKINNPSVIWQ